MALPAILDGLSYLRHNPFYLLSAARNAARLNLAVPMNALRWLVERRPRGKGPERIELHASPPGLGIGLTVDLYGTKIDVSANIEVESIENAVEELRVALRVRDLQVNAPPGTPAAMFVGSLDLSKPGSLMNMMPQKHNALVEVSDDRFVIDLLRVPALKKNRMLRRALALSAGVLTIRELSTDGDLLVVDFHISPLALPGALMRARSAWSGA